MRDQADLVRGWLRKAHSDEVAVAALLEVGAFDAACFHAQLAAEKHLKAFLVHSGVQFSYTHNLAKLVEQCERIDPSFQSVLESAAGLTPYAVELRYDDQFWPPEATARHAWAAAQGIRDFVTQKLPGDARLDRS